MKTWVIPGWLDCLLAVAIFTSFAYTIAVGIDPTIRDVVNLTVIVIGISLTVFYPYWRIGRFWLYMLALTFAHCILMVGVYRIFESSPYGIPKLLWFVIAFPEGAVMSAILYRAVRLHRMEYRADIRRK